MINFGANWGLQNEGQADEQSIRLMTQNCANWILNNGVQLGNQYQNMLQFADNVLNPNDVVTVVAGLHQLEEFQNRWYLHYTVRDVAQIAYHLYVSTEENNVENYIENVVAISDIDHINNQIVWLAI